MNVELIPELPLKEKYGQGKGNDSERQEQRHYDPGERQPPLAALYAPHDRFERVSVRRGS